MHAPQIIVIVLMAIGMWDAFMRHGETPNKPANVWYHLIGTAISVSLLYWGGFWG